MCAVMIDATPAAIAARNGSSPASIGPTSAGRERCESSTVEPCPGKCFAHAATPTRWNPRTAAAT